MASVLNTEDCPSTARLEVEDIAQPAEDRRRALASGSASHHVTVDLNQFTLDQAVDPLVIHPLETASTTIRLRDLCHRQDPARGLVEIDQDPEREPPIREVVDLEDPAEEAGCEEQEAEREVECPCRLGERYWQDTEIGWSPEVNCDEKWGRPEENADHRGHPPLHRREPEDGRDQ